MCRCSTPLFGKGKHTMRKFLIIGAMVLAGVIALNATFGSTRLCEYCHTVWENWRESANDSVPTKLKLETAENMINKMGQQIKQAKLSLIPVLVKKDKLVAEIKEVSQDINSRRGPLEELISTAPSTKTLEDDLKAERDFAEFKGLEARLASLQTQLNHCRQQLDAGRREITEWEIRRFKFQGRLYELKAAQAKLQADNRGSEVVVNDNLSGQISKLFEEIDEKIRVEDYERRVEEGENIFSNTTTNLETGENVGRQVNFTEMENYMQKSRKSQTISVENGS